MKGWLLIVCVAFLQAGCADRETVPSGPASQLPTGTIPQGSTADANTTFFESLSSAGTAGMQVYALPDASAPESIVVLIPHENFEAQIVGHPQVGISPRSAYASAALKLLIGSGYVSQSRTLEPVGLLQVEGTQLSPVQVHGYTRILGINDTNMGVVHRSEYDQGLFHSAMQAGPGIVEAGLLDISERDLKRPMYFRSFVGLCEQHWLAGISLQPVHLRTLGEQLVDLFEQRQLDCTEVVNLAGDRQAVMMLTLDDGRILYHGDINTHKVTLLGFK
ncbi:MAG: hypothetical protein AAF541_23050 [Pseudomonadota bacterium]